MWYQGDQIAYEERKRRRGLRLRRLVWFLIGNICFWLGWIMEDLIK